MAVNFARNPFSLAVPPSPESSLVSLFDKDKFSNPHPSRLTLLEKRQPSPAGASASTTTSRGSNGCVVCPSTPACPACPSGQVCNLSAQTCDTCPAVSCVDDSSTYINQSAAPSPSTTSATPSSTSSASNAVKTSNSLLAPLIAGITGCVVLLCLAAFLFFFCRRRRKGPRKLDSASQVYEKEPYRSETPAGNRPADQSHTATDPEANIATAPSHTKSQRNTRLSHGPNSETWSSTHSNAPSRPPRPEPGLRFSRDYSTDHNHRSSIYSTHNPQSVPARRSSRTWSASRAPANKIGEASLSLEEQLNYIKEQQIILEREEYEELQQQRRGVQPKLKPQPPPNTSVHAHYFPVQNLKSRVSEIPARRGSYHASTVSDLSSVQPDDAATPTMSPRLTASSLNLSTRLAQDAVDRFHTANDDPPSMINLLKQLGLNESHDRSTPYDEYLRYIKSLAAEVRPSPSSSMLPVNSPTETTVTTPSESAFSMNTPREPSYQNQATQRAASSNIPSQIIPIAYIPGVTSNFSSQSSNQSPANPRFAPSSSTANVSSLTTPYSQDGFSPRSPPTSNTGNYPSSRDTWRSSLYSANMSTAIRAARGQPSYIPEVSSSSSSDPSRKKRERERERQRTREEQKIPASIVVMSTINQPAQANRTSHPSALEPTMVARSNVAMYSAETAVDPMASVYISDEALHLDRRPIELTPPLDEYTSPHFGPSNDLSDLEYSDLGSLASDNKNYDRVLYDELEEYLEHDHPQPHILRNQSPHKNSSSSSKRNSGEDDDQRLQPFEYPVLFDSTDEISFFKT